MQGPQDDSISLNDDGLDILVNDGDNVLMPASIKKQYKQLYFRVLRGEKLPKTDRFGTIDAYVEVNQFRSSLKSSVITMANNLVEWN